MVWFAVDDTFHTHPKRIAAGNSAVGLWTACGSHCGQHLTDGHVPGGVAKLYGRAADIKALVRVRLWHGPGHDCERCPQPEPEAYVMHDYLEYNPSRNHVLGRKRIAAGVRQLVFERDEHACVTCGTSDDLTLDHIYPWSLGGADDEANLQTLCRPCNIAKGARV